METINTKSQELSNSQKEVKTESLKAILFMAFIPGIYVIGKLVSELF